MSRHLTCLKCLKCEDKFRNELDYHNHCCDEVFGFSCEPESCVTITGGDELEVKPSLLVRALIVLFRL